MLLLLSLVAAAISGQCLSITIFVHFLFNLYTNMCVCAYVPHSHKRLTNPRICCLFAWQLMKLFMILSSRSFPLPQHTFPQIISLLLLCVYIYRNIYIKMYMYLNFIEQVNGWQNMLYVRFIYESLLWHLFDYFDSICVRAWPKVRGKSKRDLRRQFQTYPYVSICFTLINESLLRSWCCKGMNELRDSFLDSSEVLQGC